MSVFYRSKRFLCGWLAGWSIHTAAFFMSFYGGIYIVSLPFVVSFVGGTDKDLGLCASLGFVSYLTGCIATGPLLDRFNPRRLAQLGSLGVSVSVAALLIIVLLKLCAQNLPHPVILVIITSAFSGLVTSLYWPPIMGWLSIGHEGPDLNRRLGVYNISWSAGLAVSPFLGGVLVQSSLLASLFVGMIFAVLAFVAITLAHAPGRKTANGQSQIANPDLSGQAGSLLPGFRWMAAIALATVFTCVGLMKTQLALLFTMELGFSKSHFGAVTAVIWLVNCLVFFAASKTHLWHYKILPLILAQLAVLGSMLVIIKSSLIISFFFVAVLMGFGQAFAYVSHQFYAASQSRKRSGSMAVHEILLSAGQIMGFLAGGYLADSFGRRAVPYWFGFSVVLTGMIVQLAMITKRPTSSPKSPSIKPSSTSTQR